MLVSMSKPEVLLECVTSIIRAGEASIGDQADISSSYFVEFAGSVIGACANEYPRQ